MTLAGALAASILWFSVPAHAGTHYWYYEGRVDLSTDGAEMTCHVYSISTASSTLAPGNDVVGHYCSVKDTLIDGHGVYMTYQIDGYRQERVNGTTPDWDWQALRNPAGPVSRLTLRVCRDKGTLQRDNCSSNDVVIYAD